MEGIKRVSFLLLNLRRTSLSWKDIIYKGWNSNILNYRTGMKTILRGYSNHAAVQNSTECISDDLFKDPKVASLLEVVVREGIKPDDLISTVKLSPELLNKSPFLWEKCIIELKSHGFESTDCFKMLALYPPLFKLVDQNELKSVMVQWMNCQLGYDNMLDILVACPHFFSVPSHELKRRIPLIQSLAKSRGAKSHGKSVVRLLQNCPGLMYENWKIIEAKLSYVENVMKIDTTKENLTKCYMFNRSLDEIKTRHMFLQRSGIYVTPKKIKGNKVEEKQQPWSRNPHLSQITDTNDEAFIRRVASNLTVEELEVFREMYKEELEEESDDDEVEEYLSDDD